jgi:exopolyphosphatase / guanosine-5'-triphosphate,3'-diphosphate pyrophosphatase
MAMTRAIVDVGSNTVRLLVACVGAAGIEPVCSERARVGLGEDVERDGRLSDVKIAAASKAVRKLCELARKRGADPVEVLVTSPGRQAANAAELVAALERAARGPVRVLGADEEARLAFRGAVGAGATAGLVAVCDLGGASTEVAVGAPEADPSWLRSFDLGALRLTTRLLADERPGPKTVEAAQQAVRQAFAALTPPLPLEAFAVGGSARALRRIVGATLGRAELARACDVLATSAHAAIARRYGVDRKRAPLLLAAALIVAEVQARLAVPLRVVDGGVREGALLASLDELAA